MDYAPWCYKWMGLDGKGLDWISLGGVMYRVPYDAKKENLSWYAHAKGEGPKYISHDFCQSQVRPSSMTFVIKSLLFLTTCCVSTVYWILPANHMVRLFNISMKAVNASREAAMFST